MPKKNDTDNMDAAMMESGGVNPEAFEKVDVLLPKDKFTMQDAFVSVCGRTYMVKRGETVSVPRFVYEALRESSEQDLKAAEMIQAMKHSSPEM